MKLFVDSANITHIKELVSLGIVDGVTTNPSLLAKEGSCSRAGFVALCKLVPGDVSLEVVEKQPEAVYKQARELAALADNVVVKIPFAVEYLPIIAQLVQENIRLNITLIFSVTQALMVMKMGVAYVSPFIGRLDDTGVNGLDLIQDLITVKKQYNFSTQILAASIRSVKHWQDVVLLGVDVATIPPSIIHQGLAHPLTSIGIKAFDADWHRMGKVTLLE